VPEITVVGSLNLDTTVRVPRLPVPGETVLGTGHFDDSGGKGANQAVAASRLGRSVAMVGQVGDDDAGRRLVSSLTVAGVDVAAVTISGTTPSGVAVITVDLAGENMIVVDPGANGTFSPSDLDPFLPVVREATVVLAQLEIPIETVATALAAATGTVILNPAPAAPLDPEVLGNVDVLVPNATELGLLAGSPPPVTLAETISMAQRLDGMLGTVVVTLGAVGAVVVGDGYTEHVPAPEVVAVDPTAAGDAFCGGLAVALVAGENLVDAVRWAVRCGAVAATRWGAQASLPTTEEVESLEGTE
jgi:ribokinase